MGKSKKTTSLAKTNTTKLIPWGEITPFSSLQIGKDSKAGVIVDHQKTPQLFIFNTAAFLDILSAVDEALVDRLSGKDYYSKKINPAGWLIDQIESQLPINAQFVDSLKAAIEEARQRGWIPFSEIQMELNSS